MKNILALLLLLLSAAPVCAAPVVTELTTGSAINATSGTTASVSPTSGALLVLVQTTRAVDCATPSVTGLSVTWTVRDSQSLISNLFVHSLWTATSTGGSGTITLGFASGTCANIAWAVYQVTGINTASSDGYVTSSHTNLTSCSPCTLSKPWTSYTKADNIQISSCMTNKSTNPSAMTKDSDTGWVQGSDVTTGLSSANDRLGLGVQWLITRGSDNAANCTMTETAAANPSMILTAEFNTAADSGVRHRVRQD